MLKHYPDGMSDKQYGAFKRRVYRWKDKRKNGWKPKKDKIAPKVGASLKKNKKRNDASLPDEEVKV